MALMRNELDDIYGIVKLQEKILKIATYIDRLCIENGIDYYLMGGSALGAVRHGGFIPWDDDLDIFMKPDDYTRFRSLFSEKGDTGSFYLQELCERDGMVASAKLRLNNSAYIEEATQNWKMHQGIFVDIFILHNTPDNALSRFSQCIAAKYILLKGQSMKNVKYHGMKHFVVAMIRFFPHNFAIKSSLKRLYKYDGKETQYVCHFMGKAFFNEGIYSAEYFRKPIRTQFENVELNIPTKTHEYLTWRFGDYMKLPPQDSIKQAQHALIWDTARDFSAYVGNKEHDFSDEKKLV